ncbi:hypothetical protein ABZ626_30845 [Streptomyces longispororuber]|uniref:hypothetical protein n=1 Tax=Streptomyces longispororuber TaxID=68230 RepID=UPI0033E1BEBA
MGDDQRKQLLAAYGSSEFEAAQRAVRTVLEHHLADADRPGVTIADRGPVMLRAARARHRRALAAAFPEHDG